MAIPTSTSVTESALIPAHLSQVWHLIKLQHFEDFLSVLKKSEEVKGASPETDVVKWHFKDGTVQEVKMEEHSVRFCRPLTVPSHGSDRTNHDVDEKNTGLRINRGTTVP